MHRTLAIYFAARANRQEGQAVLSNEEFGQRIGVSHSMASRIRSGDRLPGTGVVARLHDEFDIPLEDLMRAHSGGPKAFGALIRERVDGVASGQRALPSSQSSASA